jgi:glycogen debranching enzyme
MEIRVGPANLTIHADEQFLVCAPDATMAPQQQQGYFSSDTRIASRYQLTLADTPPTLLNSAVVAPFSARHEFANAEMFTRGGTLAANQVHLRLDRTIHHGLHEDYDLTNYAQTVVEFDLQVRVEGDYADLFDVKARKFARRGALQSVWDEPGRALTTIYRHRDFQRGLKIQVERFGSEPSFANGVLSMPIRLEPKQRWHACLIWTPLDLDGQEQDRPEKTDCHALTTGDAALAKRRDGWHQRATKITTNDPAIDAIISRAVDDLGALRMERHDADAPERLADEMGAMVPAAGIPWFLALFGRDAMVVSLQTLLLSPGLTLGSLGALAPFQGDSYDDRHDQQPGKIEHEYRRGELAHFHQIPQTPYYGTHDTTALYVRAAAELWQWTGEREAIERLRPHVERALAWVDRDGDVDQDGLQEYQTRAGDWGYYNQSWKDSGIAIVNTDGSNAKLPIATCELQGYVVAAKREWAEVVEQAFDDSTTATRLRGEADRLAETIDQRFWWAAEGTYYLGLDGDKQPIEAVASNAGHLLWTGAASADKASLVARRLREEDIWSGWGIRTLSTQHAAYNPLSYQLGSVWPHDNAIIANGLARYGHGQQAAQIARGLLEAAQRFQHARLPEVFAGLARDDGSFPVQYLGANVPQAWASGSIIHLITTLTGIHPDAPAKRLIVKPSLPDWLPEVTLANLRIGEATVDLRVTREHAEILHAHGELDLTSGTAPTPERA